MMSIVFVEALARLVTLARIGPGMAAFGSSSCSLPDILKHVLIRAKLKASRDALGFITP